MKLFTRLSTDYSQSHTGGDYDFWYEIADGHVWEYCSSDFSYCPVCHKHDTLGWSGFLRCPECIDNKLMPPTVEEFFSQDENFQLIKLN